MKKIKYTYDLQMSIHWEMESQLFLKENYVKFLATGT